MAEGCRYDGTGGRGDLDTAHPVILGDGDPVATHLTTVEAAIRAAAAEKAAIKKSKTPMKIGPKRTPPPHQNDLDDSATNEDVDTHGGAAAGEGTVKGAGGGGAIGWKFSDVVTGGGALQHSARSLLVGGDIGDMVSSIPDARMGASNPQTDRQRAVLCYAVLCCAVRCSSVSAFTAPATTPAHSIAPGNRITALFWCSFSPADLSCVQYCPGHHIDVYSL